jgi:hypothetical protein
MAKLIIDHIEKKRDALGINVKKERKLYDMEDRRQLAVEGSEIHPGCEPGLAHADRKKD